jgi:hypothetical protein
MKALLDTNILLTYITGRIDPFTKECEQIIRMCSDGTLDGYVAFHTIFYVFKNYEIYDIIYYNILIFDREEIMNGNLQCYRHR